MKRLFLAVLLSFVFLMPAAVQAHGAIFTFNVIDGDNLIKVTHNVHDAEARLPVTYNLRLYTVGGEPINFESVKVVVKHGSRVVHERSVQSSNQEANYEYTYPKMGNYKTEYAFLSHNKQVAHGSIAVPVGPGVDDSLVNQVLSLPSLLAFLVGAGIMSIFYNRRRFAELLSARKSN